MLSGCGIMLSEGARPISREEDEAMMILLFFVPRSRAKRRVYIHISLSLYLQLHSSSKDHDIVVLRPLCMQGPAQSWPAFQIARSLSV